VRRWSKVTDISPEKQTNILALSLPETDQTREPIRDLVMDELHEHCDVYESREMKNGIPVSITHLLTFMKTKLAKDDLEDCIEKFHAFDNLIRENNQSITHYIKLFDEKYRQMRKKEIELPSEVLAFKLLHSTGISETEQKLVKTGMNFEERTKLYEQAKKALLKF
jgi:hypothetical protein